MSGVVVGTLDGGIGTLVISNPTARNALTLDMYRSIPRLLKTWFEDASLRVVVVRGDGVSAFSAGGDISEFEATRAPGAPAIAYNLAVTEAERALEAMPVPVIAAIHGACVGGGCGLALACDIRIADDRARFGITAAKIGLVYGLESTRRLVDVVGPGQAMLLLGSARLVTSGEALRIGLIEEVHPPELLDNAVAALAAEIAARSSTSVRGAKEFLGAIISGLRAETKGTTRRRNGSFDGDDYREGVSAFLEQRSPVFGLSTERRQP